MIARSASRSESEKLRGTGTSWIRKSGYASRNLPSRGARKALPNPSGVPMRTVPAKSSPPRNWAVPTSTSASTRSAVANSAAPSSVSVEPRVVLSKRRAPTAFSKAAMCRLNRAWLTPRRAAAPSIWPSRATARKYRRSSQFMLSFLHNGSSVSSVYMQNQTSDTSS